MSKAEKMFNELGFKKIKINYYVVEYVFGGLGVSKYEVDKIPKIWFRSQWKNVAFNNFIPTHYLEFLAITQQMKELGWLDE